MQWKLTNGIGLVLEVISGVVKGGVKGKEEVKLMELLGGR